MRYLTSPAIWGLLAGLTRLEHHQPVPHADHGAAQPGAGRQPVSVPQHHRDVSDPNTDLPLVHRDGHAEPRIPRGRQKGPVMMSNSEPGIQGGLVAIEPGPATQAGGTTELARQPGPGGPGKHDHRAAAEAEAAATATAIAGLRWRISRPGTLEHPAVMRELGKLEEQLTAQLDSQAGRRPGRHRSPVRKAPGRDGGYQILPGDIPDQIQLQGSRQPAPAEEELPGPYL